MVGFYHESWGSTENSNFGYDFMFVFRGRTYVICVYRATNVYRRDYYYMPLPPLIVCLWVLHCIRAIVALRHTWYYIRSTAVLWKSPTLGMTSVLYPEEEALFCGESSDACQDTNGYLRDYYCMNSPSFVYLRVLYCIRATVLNSLLYPESMFDDLRTSNERRYVLCVCWRLQRLRRYELISTTRSNQNRRRRIPVMCICCCLRRILWCERIDYSTYF